ncbi:MAG: hypothetical protein KatS3mg031_2652 [Chitinophagales bacterium]|nr:MAG: hypothetical protein KatS3mg031_2652 [Chitinophagales bacterium]
MPKVLSFINRKGGTGKTTNAINVATALSEMGNAVAVIETDVNYSLSEVRRREMEKGVPDDRQIPALFQTEEVGVVKHIKNFQKEGAYDFIIVDSAANTSVYGINRISVHSDLVIVPTSLSMNDIMVAERTVKDILPAKEENPALKMVLLPNRIHVLSAYETVESALRNLNIPVLKTYIPNLKLYTFLSTIYPAEGYREVANALLKVLISEAETVA